MPTHSGHAMGNQNPKKRGLNKNIKNLKKSNKKSGCPLAIVIFLILAAGAVSTAVYVVDLVV